MIDRKEMVVLGNLPQRIHIKGTTNNNPILLFLHGGPGVCNRHTVMTTNDDLLDAFTIVAWDQRGSGGSYKNCDVNTLTIDQMVSDANELVNWLCKEFKKEKIFIIGGSWGSELGTWLAYRHPEHLGAYVGFGQVVNGAENERLSYEFALKEAKAHNDEKSLEILNKIGEPVNGVYKGGFDGMMAQRNVMMKYGGYSQNEKKRSYFQAMVVPILASKEYSFSELIGYIKGYKFVLKKMWPEVGATNLAKTCTEFKIPMFIFDGKLDMNTPASLVQDYFDLIKAPQKELIWFENSGHNPLSDEPKRFKSLLRKYLLDIAAKEEGL